MKLLRVCLAAAAALLVMRQVRAQTPADDPPAANPARPTVATPATLTPVGYLQFENGVFYADTSPQFDKQFSVNQVTKLTVTPRLQIFGMFEPFANSSGAADGDQEGYQPGGISVGAQVVALAGQGLRPTISLSYIRTLCSGNTPDIDIGSSSQSALFLWSEDFGKYHIDTNGIFNEQTDGNVTRGQFGQTVSISRSIGSFTLAGELWHFAQPLTRGNAVGNLWAVSYAIRKNLVVDAGFNHGFTSTSTQWEGFGGFTYLLPHRLWRSRATAKSGSATHE